MKPIRNPDSAPGDWYVDTACIDCAASRHVAPDLIVERNEKSVLARQPVTPEGASLEDSRDCVVALAGSWTTRTR